MARLRTGRNVCAEFYRTTTGCWGWLGVYGAPRAFLIGSSGIIHLPPCGRFECLGMGR
ncbi:hypothetical protein KCP71_06340 [Salmonella enterica subsp. enterica]|nr:hypothetical protein KCP71_06340 [Salmonella enterica subsp. enterica]